MEGDVGPFLFQRQPFRLRFLNAVLAENPLASGNYRPNPLGTEGFRDGDKCGGRRRRQRRLPRGGDAREDIGQIACSRIG